MIVKSCPTWMNPPDDLRHSPLHELAWQTEEWKR